MQAKKQYQSSITSRRAPPALAALAGWPSNAPRPRPGCGYDVIQETKSAFPELLGQKVGQAIPRHRDLYLLPTYPHLLTFSGGKSYYYYYSDIEASSNHFQGSTLKTVSDGQEDRARILANLRM